MKKYISLICFTLFFAHSHQLLAQDKVDFKAVVNKTKIGMNERLRVEFKLNKDGDNFTPPNFDGFRVIGGPSQSVQRSWINGVSSYSISYSYVLLPMGKGKYTIKQATIEVKGKVYKSIPITINVTKATTNASNGGQVIANYSQNIIIVPELSNRNPYLNQATQISYRVYYDDSKINLSAISFLDMPDYTHFWKKEIPIKEYKFERKVYKGKNYNSFLVSKNILYPQKNGKIKISPITIDLTASIPTGRHDFFGQRVYQQKHISVSSPVANVTVKPLPKENKPIDFKGAVGDFSMSLNLNKDKLKVADPLQLSLKIKGIGFFNFIKMPEVITPSSIDVYDPETKKNLRETASGIKGNITDTYTLIPQRAGNFTIPNITFSYFNPKEGKYHTIKSRDIQIQVELGDAPIINHSTTNTDIPIKPTDDEVKKQNIPKAIDQFEFIKTSTKLISKNKKQGMGALPLTSFILIALGSPFMALILLRKKTVNKERSKRIHNDKLVKKYLSEAKKNIHDTKEFYITIERCLHSYIKSILNIDTSQINKESISSKLHEKEVDTNVIDEMIDLLKKSEISRYTPSMRIDTKILYEQAIDIISQIDKSLSA